MEKESQRQHGVCVCAEFAHLLHHHNAMHHKNVWGEGGRRRAGVKRAAATSATSVRARKYAQAAEKRRMVAVAVCVVSGTTCLMTERRERGERVFFKSAVFLFAAVFLPTPLPPPSRRLFPSAQDRDWHNRPCATP